jgi:hypothetical protein
MNIKRIATIVSNIFTAPTTTRNKYLLSERAYWKNQLWHSEYNLKLTRKRLADVILEKNREIESLKTQLKTIRQIFDEYGNNSEMLNHKLFELFMGTSVENLNTTLKATAKLFEETQCGCGNGEWMGEPCSDCNGSGVLQISRPEENDDYINPRGSEFLR